MLRALNASLRNWSRRPYRAGYAIHISGDVIGTKAIHLVVVSIGSAGDLFPMMRLAEGMRDMGHRVTVLAPEQHRPYIELAGLGFHPLQVDEAVLDDPKLWTVRHGFGVVWRATRPAAAGLITYIRQLPAAEPCVLLVHPLALPEADACRVARPDVRIAAAYLAPSNLPTVYDPLLIGPYRVPAWVPPSWRRALWRRIGAHLVDPVVLPAVNTLRRGSGLAPVGSALEYLFKVADLSLVLFPRWFAKVQPDWPQPLMQSDFPLYDPDPAASMSLELRAFLAAGDAPIVVTPGTGNRQARTLFAAATDACERLGRRAIFLTPHVDQLPLSHSDNILWQPYVPLRTLLPHCAALAHHGGIGTTAEALLSGIPQLVLPFAHDQFDNATRITALGVGLHLPAAGLSSLRLTEYLRRLLSSHAIAVKAAAVAGQFGAGPDFGAMYAALAELPR